MVQSYTVESKSQAGGRRTVSPYAVGKNGGAIIAVGTAMKTPQQILAEVRANVPSGVTPDRNLMRVWR